MKKARSLKFYLLFSIYLFASLTIWAQTDNCLNKAFVACQNEQLDTSLFYFNNCINLTKDAVSAKQLYELGDCYFFKRSYEEAITCYTALLKKGATAQQWTGRDSVRLYKDIGYCHYDLFKYKTAFSAFEKALDCEKGKREPDNRSLIDIYFKQSDCFVNMNAFEKAADLLQVILNICTENPEKHSEQLGETFIHLAKVSMWKGDCSKAIAYANKFEKHIIKIKETNDPEVGFAFVKIGRIYRHCAKYKSALTYFHKAKYYYKKYKYLENKGLYKEIADCYFFLKNYQKAIEIYKFTYKYYKDNRDSDSEYLAILNSKIAACYTNLDSFTIASTYFDKALQLSHFLKFKKHPFEQTSDKRNLLTLLYFKAKNHLKSYDQSHAIEDLHLAQEWYDRCIQLIDNIFKSISLDSKQYFLDNTYYIYESIIETNYQLYLATGEEKYTSQALFYAEKSRSILLKEAMLAATAEILSTVPAHVFEYEYELKSSQIALENLVFETKASADKKKILSLKKQIIDIKKQRRNQDLLIQKKYPNYERLRIQKDTLRIKTVREQLLRPNEIMLHYFVGDAYIYVLSIDETASKMLKIKKEAAFEKDIQGLRKSIYQYALKEEHSAIERYKKYAFDLYNLIIKPLDLPTNSGLLIIPDGLLEYLPFDALLKEKPATNDFSSFPFLVLDYNIRYLHSALTGIQKKKNTHKAKYQKILAVAPIFSGNKERKNGFNALRNNVLEVTNIQTYFPTKILKGTAANVEEFKKVAGQYSCLHLATHAMANDEDGEHSFLAFSATGDTAKSSILYAREICLMDLNADMVVLSACETGVGKLRRGEGIISLARGFSYAGAESLITTLWRVSDEESAIFMAKFYQGLKQGLSKNDALHKAKLHFIQKESLRRKHPFFWAAYIPLGNMDALELNDNSFFHSNWPLLLSFLLFITALLFYLKKRKKNLYADPH